MLAIALDRILPRTFIATWNVNFSGVWKTNEKKLQYCHPFQVKYLNDSLLFLCAIKFQTVRRFKNQTLNNSSCFSKFSESIISIYCYASLSKSESIFVLQTCRDTSDRSIQNRSASSPLYLSKHYSTYTEKIDHTCQDRQGTFIDTSRCKECPSFVVNILASLTEANTRGNSYTIDTQTN